MSSTGLQRYISLGVTAFCIGLFAPMALVNTSLTWYGLYMATIVWEFSTSSIITWHTRCGYFGACTPTHHAPEQMNLSVTYAHLF